MKIENGCLSMDNHNLEHIQVDINDGFSAIEALINELDLAGLDVEDIKNIQLNGEQLSQLEYVETYSKIVTDFWNNK
ncbi:hypothetical protein CLQ_13603 (plasmid) [Clostridium botulinum Af84]|uniref:hypothetical protein n=1 Tax=Clostridium botulinum TaxID=1491 RepID=UPI00035BA8A7|nr:hypothetical protein [Clostridium botulinum]APR02822.1 hypothetical protein RSJ2_3873 [Clostridium botulinum]AUN19739.1 hypothetical protein B2M06_19485 [Clostridium botulinum]EPS54326.1 hypothetical protein CLQ_13603 [Clostridium botulinum Af84]NFM82261.1 hypothetical protein [Clostridium botulinum]NFP09952.1 hypothetical protein [Clostridium botulinum]